VLVTLRPGLVTARGKALDARDVVASIERARKGVARALLAPFPTPRRDDAHPLTVHFDAADPDALVHALASPSVAIVPRGASPRAPDGTGAFHAAPTKDLLVLERNERAARGPAYLERIDVRAAPDLASALRSFESGDADLGFLGAGLHRRRAGAVDFRTEPIGSVVLRSGSDAHAWGAPGVAAELAAGIDSARLATLGITATARGERTGWGGAPSDVLVDAGAPYLGEVARVVAETLSRPGHEIRPLGLPRAELRARLVSGKFALAVDFVRRIGGTERHALLALLATLDPRLADKPPDPQVPAPAVLRTLPAAVIGELAVVGAHTDDVEGLERWDLGAALRVHSKPA
jgi:peptide/nickel transport system substrate-binding protein